MLKDRIVELTLQLKNAQKSVGDLETTIKDINGELKKIPVNSQGILTEMASLSRQAGTQLKNINEELRVFSDEKQLRAE